LRGEKMHRGHPYVDLFESMDGMQDE